ncbi:DUF357 domain-containing protein [Methanospirillum stamsii]|uniref:DUF357 domain-containing protein n=1 Tax=Methanospirillum stamsii TaxID=1277351 RepID=A0A2V2N594_9EURY|nr:DUF357 domain-containing protein [Methanospirillum stamsii]PWR74989.1 hypothetical protein DLD82_07125 [Methanospirillum stamsii]
MHLPEYFLRLQEQCESLTCSCPKGSPYHILGKEITEMISSYLDDSCYFSSQNDIVNQYASLVYAHGWLDAAIFLGIISAQDNKTDFLSVISPVTYNSSQLIEKETRYFSMLTTALTSISNFPATGSPLHTAGKHCVKIAQEAVREAENLQKKNDLFPALGYLCYGYGWLDTAIRSGLVKITSHPELFTTER